MIVIIEYGAGNLCNLHNALNFLKIPCTVSSDLSTIMDADRIIVAVDVKGDRILRHGWSLSTGIKLEDFVKNLEQAGVTQIIYTDVGRDGMLGGIDVKGLKKFESFNNLKISVSGGISDIHDIIKLKMLQNRFSFL